METGKSILIMGRPGIGKTTMLREAARVLADDMGKRVVVVDTSNEIAGDGDIPHPAIGKARRMQVRTPSLQHEVMIEAVENHMPQVIVIDEIGTELEAQAARTIAERGVQLIGTAHGNNLDNLMLNPTLSDLIGGIQSVTLGDEEARRRRTQKSVLERKAPPTFDVIVEIQDRERVAVHSDVADTVDAMLRGDPVAPGTALARRGRRPPVPGPAAAVAARAARRGTVRRSRRDGLAVADGARLARRRGVPAPAAIARPTAAAPTGRAIGRARPAAGGRPVAARAARPAPRGTDRRVAHRASCPVSDSRRLPDPASTRPFVSGDIADRGPLERAGTASSAETRAREARELERQKAWRDQASRALNALKAEEGTGPVNADELEDDGLDDLPLGVEEGAHGETLLVPGGSPLPTLRILPQGISRKRLEQAIRDLQLPVVIARDVDEADVVMTLKNEYKQKTPMLRDAEDRAMPIYVLKSNTVPQMQSSLTSIFSLEIDPREAALRETEDAIGACCRPRNRSSSRRRTRTSADSSTRWPSERTSCRDRAAASRTGASASTPTRHGAPGDERWLRPRSRHGPGTRAGMGRR